jgi:putative (di)nucleoside polyphosphate hydrolase
MTKGQFFRASVGAIIRGPNDHILALERSDVPGAWQLPQGGLDAGEEPIEAVLREISEETGIGPAQLTLVAQAPELLAYELPLEFRNAKTDRGQVQYWFLCDYDDTTAIRLPEQGEFRAWQWTTFEALLGKVVAFRRPVYTRLAEYAEWSSPPTGGPLS